MYIPKPPPRPVHLHGIDGGIYTYSSIEELVRDRGLRWLRESLGPAFRVCAFHDHCRAAAICPFVRLYPFVLKNDEGQVLDYDACFAAWRDRSAPANGYRWYPYWNGTGPVPRTGKRPAGGHWFRRIRTYGEHRAAAAVLPEEGEPPFRAARRRPNLPSAWDDCPISAHRDRSWKRHRRTQWRPRRGG